MTTISNKNRIAILLFTSFLLLSSLVPGGPIETRSFAHINPAVLLSFNTFLTTLALGSAVITLFVWKDLKWAYFISTFFAVSYFIVYALDLATIFPVSPDGMPMALLVIEVIGLIVSIPLTLWSIQELFKTKTAHVNHSINKNLSIAISLALLLLGLTIIIFATLSAMQ